jgi:insulysin
MKSAGSEQNLYKTKLKKITRNWSKNMKLKSVCFSLLLLSQPLCFASEQGYQVIPDKATLPLLNPSFADRKVLKLRLDNGLEAYLISDPGAKQSAAALSVEAGSWNDPKEYPGMAHFLEHMLFMGNAAYPKEFEYMQFIADHGGLVNAYTASDRTVYMFSVNNEAFDGALDRFSHFFIDPLFLPSCIGRELHAVDQEHSKNVENDLWREYMILKETGNTAHPNAAFSTGNAKTLSGIPQSALKEWYQKNYSAQKMHLTVISPLPMDQITQAVVADFSKVANNGSVRQSLTTQMSSAQQMGHIIYIKPLKDLKRLSLVWEVPSQFILDNEKKAVDLVAYVMKTHSETGLLEQLKREKLAEDLDVTADRFGKEHLLFRIDIDLTEEGLRKIDTAIERCFQEIARLKEAGIPAYLFDEMKMLSQLSYQYQSREDAFAVAMKHADDMVNEELATYPEKTSIPTTYDAAFVSSFLQNLSAQRCMFFVQADPSLTGVAPEKHEKWMNAEYAIKEIKPEKLTAWNAVPLNPKITLPQQNPFIPSHLALVTANPAAQTPRLIADDTSSKIYFAQDDKYLVPETSMIFNLKTPLIDGSAKKFALLDLYLKALGDKLSPTLSFASAAGLYTSVNVSDLKLTFSISGYSEKAPALVKTLFQHAKQVAPSAEQFEIYKQSLASSYDNVSKELPVRQAADVISSIIYNDAPTSQEKLKALKTVSYDEFMQYSKTLLKTSFTEGVIYGNLNEQDAKNVWADVKATLASAPYLTEQQNRKSVLLLPDKHGPYMLNYGTERQGNGVILLIEEGAFSFEKRASQQLLGKALKEAFFDTLRTKQQTAYIAKAWDLEVERQLLQFFAVQSNSHNPSELLARFELFLEDFVGNFQDKVSPDRFETLREMMIVTLKKPPENLSLMAEKLNYLAFTCGGDFNWIEKSIDAVSKLSYEQLETDAKLYLSRQNQKRLAVLVEGVLSADKEFRYERVSHDDVRGAGTYVTWK